MYIDVALGLLVGFIVSVTAGEQYLMLMLFGVFATLAPDIDFLVWLIKNKWKVNQYAHEHRDLLHRPLIFGLGGGLLIALIDPLYGVVWFLGTTVHFMHDTIDGGWGIQWLHPFYYGYFTLASYSPKRHIRSKEEQRDMARVYGNPHWLEEQYLKPNPKLMIEFLVLGSVLVLLFYFFFVPRVP